MLKHILEVVPKLVKVGTIIRKTPYEQGLRVITVGPDNVVYVVTIKEFDNYQYAFVEYKGYFGWINIRWLEEIS